MFVLQKYGKYIFQEACKKSYLKLEQFILVYVSMDFHKKIGTIYVVRLVTGKLIWVSTYVFIFIGTDVILMKSAVHSHPSHQGNFFHLFNTVCYVPNINNITEKVNFTFTFQ